MYIIIKILKTIALIFLLLIIAAYIYSSLRTPKKIKIEVQKSSEELKQIKIVESVNNEFLNKINKLGYIDSYKIFYDSSTNLSWDTRSHNDYWDGANNYCYNSNFKGYNDWYLPDRKQLINIIENHPNILTYSYKSAYDYWTTNDSSYAHGWSRYSIRKSFCCVKNNKINTIGFDSSKKLKLFKSIYNSRRLKGKHSYSEKPAKEIEAIIKDLVKLYTPSHIKKDILQNFPKLVKSEYETKSTFNNKQKEETRKKEILLEKIEKEYKENLNFRIEKIQYINNILPRKISEFQKSAFKTVMGGYKLTKRIYEVETSTMYVTMKANKANYSKKISLHIAPDKAKIFSDNIKKMRVLPIFEFKNNRIILKSISIIDTLGNIYLAILDKNNLDPIDININITEIK